MKPKSTKREGRGKRHSQGDATGKTDIPPQFPIAGVGASAGGLQALKRFLRALPASSGGACVLVQHLEPKQESGLTENLSHATAMRVVEVEEGMQVEPNRVYVVPANKSISITGRTLHFEPRRNSQTQNTSADFPFRSLAADWKHKAIGIILSGTASDGATGLRAIQAEIQSSSQELRHRSSEPGEMNQRLEEELAGYQQAEGLFRTMVESAPDAMVITNPDGKIVLVNRQTERAFGYNREELIGQSIEILVPEHFRNQRVFHRGAYPKSSPARSMGGELDLRGLRKDGSEFPVEISLSPLSTEDGDFHLISSIIRDVTRQRALAERVRQAALIEERNRMARDLHDTLAQGLAGVVLQLGTAEEEFKQGSPRVLRRIARARELARSTIEETRRSTLSLSGSPIAGNGLSDSIREMVNRLRSGTGIRLEFSLSGKSRRLHAAAEENLLRIAQQAITNALQHAEASRIRVELKFNTTDLRLRVMDNGRGFVPSATSDGFGLRSMRERANHLGGNFKLTSRPGKGAQIDVEIPIAPPTAKIH